MPESLAQLERSPDIWYDDGNAVLQTANTLFKVYKGFLSKESALFRDMFSLPQPEAGAELYEGCLLVKLYDEAAQLRLLLLAIFSYEFLISECNCIEYATILRMASKYQADGLRKRVITILRGIYPDTLQGWDNVRTESHHPSTHLLHRLALDDLASHVAIINAAGDAEAQILLPAAMLRLFRRGIKDIVEAARASQLDATLFLEALPALSTLSRTHSFALLFSHEMRICNECLSLSQCYAVRHTILRELEKPSRAYVADPFVTASSGGGTAYSFCRPCGEAFQASHETGRRQAWEELPACFKLPHWQTMRTHAMQLDAEDSPGGSASDVQSA